MIDDLPIGGLSAFSANQGFPCESLPRNVFIRGLQGKGLKLSAWVCGKKAFVIVIKNRGKEK
jgi:hypothetical protein